MNAAELVELRKQGSISQEEFFVGLNRLRRANNGSSAAVAEASAADLIPGGSDGLPAPARHQRERCSSSDSAGSAVDTAASCAVGSIDAPAAGASVEIVGQRSTVDFVDEPSGGIPSVAAPTGGIGSTRDDVVLGDSAPKVQCEGYDSPAVPSTESHYCGMVLLSHSSSPESKQQNLFPGTPLDSDSRTEHRADEYHGDVLDELAGADDDSEWLISPSGERTRQSTSNRRRSTLGTREMLQRQNGIRTLEHGDNRCINGGSSSSSSSRVRPVAAGCLPQKGGNHRVSEQVALERRHPVESPSWRPAGVSSVQPNRQQLGGHDDNSGSGSRRLSQSQPTSAPRNRDTYGANSGGGYSNAGYPSRRSSRRTEGGQNRGVAEDATNPTPRPSWRPAGGGNFQSHRRSSVVSNGSSDGGRRRLSRSLPMTPLRSYRRGGGEAREDDGHRGSCDNESCFEESPSRRSADGRTAASRGRGSPAEPYWRRAGEGQFGPCSDHGEGVGRRSRSQPATPSRSFSSGTAYLPTKMPAENCATASPGVEKSVPVGESERGYRRGVYNGSDVCNGSDVYNGHCCNSSAAGYPDPCRSPPQRNRRPCGPEPRTEENEGEAFSPTAPAAAGGSTGNRAPATPYANRRRRRRVNYNSSEQDDERIVNTEVASEEGIPPETVQPRGAATIGDNRTRWGGGCGSDIGVKTAPSSCLTGGLWRNRSRHRESQGEHPPSPEPQRRHRGNTHDSVESFGSGRYRKPAVRCDRYGYPLHERECLGSTGVCGGGSSSSSGHQLRFSPMIKGLPDFYGSRPKRQGHNNSFEQNVASGDIGLENASTAITSLYQRTTEWQARASELRARKLAQREEQELSDCTFQPNVPRREALGIGGASKAVGPVGTSGSGLHQPEDAGRDSTGGVDGGGDGGGDGVSEGGGDGGDVDRGDCGSGGIGGGDEGEERMREGVSDGTSNKAEEKRLSGVSKGSAASPQRRLSGNVAQRLFDEAGRMDERRFEGQERKRMLEEETYARTCTFQPSLVQRKFGSTICVPSRYRDPPRAASAPPEGRCRELVQEALTFHPKILGVKPGMTRALEYISLGVTERLYHAPSSNTDQQQRQQTEAIFSQGRPLGGQRLPDGGFDYDSDDDEGRREEGGYPQGFHSPQSERLGKGRRFRSDGSHCSSIDAGLGGSDRGGERDRARGGRGLGESYFGGRRDGRRLTPPPAIATIRSGRQEYAPPERHTETYWSHRPRSAPAAAGARADAEDGSRRSGARRMEGRAGTGEARARVDRLGGGSWAERVGGGSDRGGGGWASQGQPRRQNPISFREFLARQAHSQATAKKHLSRLTAQQSPSFTPQLSRGTRRMVARNGGVAASAGGGRFEDRLNVAARRRARDRKAALLAARTLEGKACTFVPQVTPRARTARSRSARELSLGDSVLREAKLRMARAREEIRLLDNHHHSNNGPAGDGGRSFEPRLETAGDDGLAPPASSRLRLADELDTYVDRVQEAARKRDEHLSREKRRQQAEEEKACTFQPQMKASRCPDLVKRTAAGMRCIREFRRQQEEEQRREEEAFLMAGSGGRGMPPEADRPRWRYT